MTLLIIGCGSIGSRHARNARALGHTLVVCDPNLARAQALGAEVGATAFFADYKEAIEKGPRIDAAVVATPSAYHVADALYLAEHGIPIFMEKPLATSTEGLSALVDLVQSKNIITMMGQSYRFHEGVLALKKIVESGHIGRPYHVNYDGGQYLPSWHPKEDYRREYSAQKKLGGGAMFTMMSHSLDLVEWLFGAVKEYSGWKARVGPLEIDVDDTASVLITTAAGVEVFARYDFLSQPARYMIEVWGESGHVAADLISHTIVVTDQTGTQERSVYAFEPNWRYAEELRYFLALVERGEEDASLNIAHGAHIVELLTDPRIRDLTPEGHE